MGLLSPSESHNRWELFDLRWGGGNGNLENWEQSRWEPQNIGNIEDWKLFQWVTFQWESEVVVAYAMGATPWEWDCSLGAIPLGTLSQWEDSVESRVTEA